MVFMQQACLFLVAFLYAIVGSVDGTGQQASVIGK
jgi:hypothetical protein